jgi:hypothetical protein
MWKKLIHSVRTDLRHFLVWNGRLAPISDRKCGKIHYFYIKRSRNGSAQNAPLSFLHHFLLWIGPPSGLASNPLLRQNDLRWFSPHDFFSRRNPRFLERRKFVTQWKKLSAEVPIWQSSWANVCADQDRNLWRRYFVDGFRARIPDSPFFQKYQSDSGSAKGFSWDNPIGTRYQLEDSVRQLFRNENLSIFKLAFIFMLRITRYKPRLSSNEERDLNYWETRIEYCSIIEDSFLQVDIAEALLQE